MIPFLFECGNIAHSIATGAGFSSPFHINTGPTAWMPPLYPLILAGIMRLFGSYTFHAYLAAVLLNIGFSTLVCIPLFFAAKRIGGTPLAVTTAWLWAIFPNAILLSFQSMWDTSLSALLGSLLLWATLRVPQSGHGGWCAYGGLWGVAAMTNASLLSLLPFLLGWAIYRAYRERTPWVVNAALCASLIALCCVPWTARNYAVFHAFIPLRSVLGLQLWVGNNPQAKVIWLGEQHPINDNAERAKYVELGEVAYMRQKQHDAVQYMLTHPRREAELMAGRFVELWSGGTPIPFRDFSASHSAWFRYVLLFNLAAALGAAAGIVVLFHARSPFAFPAAIYPIVFPCAYYLTLAMPRYRLPVDPEVLLLLSVALLQGVRYNSRLARKPFGANESVRAPSQACATIRGQ